MNQEEDIDECKNDLFTIFFDTLITLYVKQDYTAIRKILIGSNEPSTHKFVSKDSNCAKYIDEDSIVPIRVWTDNETKKYLDMLYYVCKDENTIVSLNNKIIESWLCEMNTIMSRFFYKSRNVTCTKGCRMTFRVENRTWNEFISRCSALNITQLNGFKTCVSEFISQRAKIFL